MSLLLKGCVVPHRKNRNPIKASFARMASSLGPPILVIRVSMGEGALLNPKPKPWSLGFAML